MAKALKTAGMIVAGAALVMTGVGAIGGLAAGFSAAAGVAGLGTAVGISAGTLFSISAGLSLGSSLLAPRVKAPDVSSANQDRLTASIDPRAPRKILFGSTALATDIRDQEYTEGQKYLHRWIAVASHKIHAVREIWFDGELAWSAAGGVQGKFAPWLQVQIRTEGTPANAINIGARMGSSRRFTGCAYVYLRYQILAQSKKTDSVFHQSIPSRIIIVGDAAYLYDPRLDSSVGGSGPMRANDQTTWSTSWTADRGRNPILQMLFYLLGYRIQNPATGEWKVAVGRGYPPERIDMQSFITAANLCDEPVQRAVGGTEPRYRSDGIFSESDDPQVVLDNLKATANAVLDDVDGKIRVSVLHNDLAAPIGDLTEDDVIGGFEWEPSTPLLQSYNVYRGGFTDPSTRSLYQLIDCPEIRIPSPDGIDRAETVNLPLVQSPSQWQRLVKQRAQRNLYPGLFRASFQATAWRFQKGDVIRFRFAPLGWDYRLFRIVDAAVQVDGLVPMVLRVEHASIYNWDGSDAPAIVAAEPFTYDAQLGPLALAIGDAGETAVWSAIADDNAHKPEDNATKGARIGENIWLPGQETPLPREELVTSEGKSADTDAVGGRLAADVLQKIDKSRDDLDTAVSNLDQYREATDEQLGSVDARLNIGATRNEALESAERQRERQLDMLAEAATRVALESGRTRAILRDAGVFVDPVAGTVTISAIEQNAEKLSEAVIRISASEAAIVTRATVTWVQEQIALAVLDPEQAAQLEPILFRLTQAEQSISGLLASIITKADAVTVTALSGVVVEVSETLSALSGIVQDKADATIVDQLGIRVASVEQTLSVLGDIVGIETEVRQARYSQEDSDEAALRALLTGQQVDRGQRTQLALAREQLTTELVERDRAQAQARLVVAAEVAENKASASQQFTALAETDAVQAESIEQLTGEIDGAKGDITELREINVDRDQQTAGIVTAVRQQRSFTEDAAETALRDTLLGADAARRQRQADVGVLRELGTRITEAGEVEAREFAEVRAALSDAAKQLSAAVTSLNQAIVNGDGAQASALAEVRADLAGVNDALNAAVTILSQAIVNGDTANADSIQSITTQIGEIGASVDIIANAVTELEGKNQAWLTLVAEAGTGRAIATLRADGETGAGEIDFAARAIRMLNDVEGGTEFLETLRVIAGLITITGDIHAGAGRMLFNNGNVMLALGTGFGSSDQFILWYGPALASLDLCTRANGLFYLSVDADAALEGGLFVGDFKNAAQTTLTGTDAAVVLGPFASDGGQRLVNLSYSYDYSIDGFSAGPTWSGTMSALVRLERAATDAGPWTFLVDLPVADGEVTSAPAQGGDPGYIHARMQGALTFTDNAGGETLLYRARLLNRQMVTIQGEGQQQAIESQRIAVVSIEE